ncbi:MAG: 50S ribosomal protein L18e [Methanosarcinaceae archaeon]|nr:50S ribosomal protein L18e [Methanosarcinaceae archaeon]
MSKRTQSKISRKADPRIPSLIAVLKETARENDAPVWRDIAIGLEAPKRNHAQVNLSKLNRYTKENQMILVPGKVLGAGVIGHALIIGALGFSAAAQDKITSAGGKCMTIEQALDENPDGSGIRIMR